MRHQLLRPLEMLVATRAARHQLRRLSSQSTDGVQTVNSVVPFSLRLRWCVEDVVDERALSAAVLRTMASTTERVASLQALRPVHDALEGELDALAAADATGPAGAFWAGHGARLRRGDVLAAALAAERPPAALALSAKIREQDDADERLWSPATRQYVRRVRAAAALDGDLLLGHCFAAHVYAGVDLPRRLDAHAHERRLGLATTAPARPVALDAAEEALDAAGADLDDEKIEAIAHEAARGLKLLTNVLMERPGLYRGAAAALWRVASSKLAEQLRPSPA